MRIVSVNVGLPRTLEWQGESFLTGICKEPVEGRLAVRPLNLDGDGQADLVNHGGLGKAVYAYPFEHYPFWSEFLGLPTLPGGALGENVTVEGLDEETTFIGDVLRFGTAELVVTQPREPCFKLAARYGRADIVRQFLQSGRSGFYLSVRREGEIAAGDTIELLKRGVGEVAVSVINRAHRGAPIERELLERAATVDPLPEYWRKKVVHRLDVADRQAGKDSESGA